MPILSSDGSTEYSMIRTPGGWQHEGAGCEWWLIHGAHEGRRECRHIAEARKREAMSEEGILDDELTRAVAVYKQGIVVDGEIMPAGELYRMIDEFDASLIADNVEPEVVESWCYAFPQGGALTVGLSIRGVETAIREQMKHGEVIRIDKPEVELENDDEIRLVCTARRFLVRPDSGELIEVDFATRALRQLKYQMVDVKEETGERWPSGQPKMRVKRDARGKPVKEREDDPKWYEKAYSKAARNAAYPLLRPDVKSEMLRAYRGTPKFAAIAEGRPYNPNQLAAPAAEGDQRQTAPPANQQPRENRRQTAQRGQGAANRAPAATDTPKTQNATPAPPQRAQGANSVSDSSRGAKILNDIRQSQGEERWRSVYADLVKTFPAAADRGQLKAELVDALAPDARAAFLARLGAHQAELDPDAKPAEEPAEGEFGEITTNADGGLEGENVVACVNCATPQVLEPDAAPDTPCASCGRPIGIQEVFE